MAHEHIVYDSDPHFSIDVDTRAITYTSPDKLMLIQGDHNSEVFTFDMPKEADGHDMTKCDIKQVHFINLDGERGVLKSVGVYVIDDMKEDSEDPNKLVFSWTVSHTATRYVGSLSFAIKLACSGEDSTYEYVWSTLPYSSVPVSKTIENTEEFVGDYADALQDWYTTITAAGQQGVDAIDEARRQAVANVQNALSNVGGIIVSTTPPTVDKAVAWLNPVTSVLRVKGEDGTWKTLDAIKGEPGGLNNVVQEFGDDEGLVISQKAITEKITELEEKDQELQRSQESDSSSFIDIARRLDSLEEDDVVFNGALINFSSRIDENTNRISEVEQVNAALDEKVAANTNDIVSLVDAYTECSNRITEAEASISDMNTETSSRIDALEQNNEAMQEQLDSINPSLFTVHKSGTYVGDGSTSFTPPIYFGTKFKPDFVVIKDTGKNMSDLVIMRDYYDSLYEGNVMLAQVLNADERSLIQCNFGETSNGTQRLHLSTPGGGNSLSASRIYNNEGTTYFWFAIGTQIQS